MSTRTGLDRYSGSVAKASGGEPVSACHERSSSKREELIVKLWRRHDRKPALQGMIDRRFTGEFDPYAAFDPLFLDPSVRAFGKTSEIDLVQQDSLAWLDYLKPQASSTEGIDPCLSPRVRTVADRQMVGRLQKQERSIGQRSAFSFEGPERMVVRYGAADFAPGRIGGKEQPRGL